MSTPLVTVITVTYNSMSYVRDAIESVLLQSYDNIEYIIVDDNSSDETWKIIQDYTDARIRAFRNPVTLGEYPNRNRAVSLATGEFIYFIDGDDLLLYRGIEDTVKDIVRFPECEFAVVRPENPKYVGPIEIKRIDALNLEFFGGGVLDSSLANNIFRTEFLKKNLFYTQYKNADTYSRISFLKTSNLLVLITPIAIWRLTENQTSNKVTLVKRTKELLNFYKEHIFNSKEFSGLNQHRLRKRYYKTLLSYILFSLRSGKLPLDIQGFLMDHWMDAVRYLFREDKNNFWDHYNYYNINIHFRNKDK